MSGYRWHGDAEESRILNIDVYTFVDGDYFECKDFHVEFSCVADARDFLSILDGDDFHYVQVSETSKIIYLKPKCCETCRKALSFLRGYGFLPQDIEEAYNELHLLPGTHWFDVKHFTITYPY